MTNWKRACWCEQFNPWAHEGRERFKQAEPADQWVVLKQPK